MITDNTNYWNSPVRSFVARVELYLGSALADAYTAYYGLKSFKIERVGDNTKFFGYGICQKMNLKLIDKDRAINITTDHSLKAYLSTGGELITPAPVFYVTEVHRDENNNDLSITAYDALYGAANHTVSELTLPAAANEEAITSYYLYEFAEACAAFLGCSGFINKAYDVMSFETYYPAGANFEGTESIRAALDALAEATQTIYYIDKDNYLVFKSLDRDGEPDLTITKEDYIKLESKENRRLSKLVYATELGDNLETALDVSGSTQYIRDNPFWDVFESSTIAAYLDYALTTTGGLTIAQFDCNWRGNYALEIGDKIGLITKDNQVISSYILDDVITYNGSLEAQTRWSYTDNEGETASTPTTLGEALNRTFARVDKVNQEIVLQVEKTDNLENTTNDSFTELRADLEALSTTVKSTETITEQALNENKEEINKVKSDISNFKQTSTEALLSFKTSIEENGVDKVTVTKDEEKIYKFDADGLTISDSKTDINTTITENGMQVKRGGEVVLTADNQGVQAEDLHATTYLIIGNNSRFEDYGNRTGCFWI